MQKTEKLFVKGFSMYLNNVEYNFVGDPKGSELRVHATEKYKLIKCSKGDFSIEVQRIIEMEPDYYNLQISTIVHFSIDEKTYKYLPTKKDISKYVDDNKKSIISKTPVGNGLSLLISQITSSFGNVPVITPRNME